MRRLLLPTLIFALLFPLPAFAQPSEEDLVEAQRLYEQAVQLYKDKQYAEAAGSLEKAYEYDPNPTLAYNIGKSYEDFGELENAKKWYRIALSYEDLEESEVRKAVKAIERIENIEAKQPDELSEATLQLTSDPVGAIVYLGDKPLGVTPLEHVTEPGVFTIRVEADGYETYTKEVDASRGGNVQLHAVLGQPSLLTWVYVTGGIAVLGAGAGIAGDMLALSAEEDALKNRNDDALREDAKDTGKAMQGLAIAGYTLAGVAATTAVVLLIIELTGTETVSGDYESLGFGITPGGASFTLRW